MVAIRPIYELESKAEAEIVVAVLRRVIVPIRNPAVLRIVIPAAAAIHAIRALQCLTFNSMHDLFP